MSLWSNLTVEVVHPSTGATLGDLSAEVVSISGNNPYDKLGNGRMLVHVGAADVGQLINGRLIRATIDSLLYSSTTIPICMFIIQSARLVWQNGATMIEVTGPKIGHELTYRSFGENLVAAINSSTLTGDTRAENSTTTLASGASSGASSIVVTSATMMATGQPIHVVLDSGSTHTTTISSVSGTTIGLTDNLAGDAAAGNEVTTAKTLSSTASSGASSVSINNAGGFAIGQPISIELDAGGTHDTLITNVSGTTITFADTLPSTATSGNEVTTETGYRIDVATPGVFYANNPIFIDLDDGSQHATIMTAFDSSTILLAAGLPIDPAVPVVASSGNTVTGHSRGIDGDIDVIMGYAPSGWSSTGNTPNGSYLIGAGESVFEMLELARQQGGGHWRIDDINRELFWAENASSSGLTGLVMPSSPASSQMTSENYGIILDLVMEEETIIEKVTRITAVGANGLKFTSAEPYVTVPSGFSVDWAAGIITNTTAESGGAVRIDRYISFDNIQPAGDTDADTIMAAIQLFEVAYNRLVEFNVQQVRYTVKCVIHKAIEPFSTVPVTYDTHDLSISDTLLIQEIALEVGADGILYHTLTLSDVELLQPQNDESFIARKFQKIENALKHIRSTTGSGGGSAALGTSTQHHNLQGLGDDDHSLYLRADGGRTLTGNLPVSPSITIDGVDISAHAADAEAHHNEVSIGTGGLSAKLSIAAGQVLTLAAINHSDLSNITANQHHNQVHDVVGSDHTVTGSTLDVVGLTATDTIGLLTPSADPGAASALLKSDSGGGLILQSLQVEGSVDIVNNGNLTVGSNVLFVNNSGSRVGINTAPDAQFALDINGNIRWSGWGVGRLALQINGALMICHFDGKLPYETDYSGTAVGHKGQAADWDGGIIFRPGKFDKAVQIAEGVTNLVTNPSFETNTTNWASAWSDTLTRVASRAYIGSYCLEIQSDGGANTGARYDTTVSASTAHSVQLQIYVPSNFDGNTPVLNVYDGAAFTTLLGTVSSTVTDEWELLTVENVTPSTTTLRVVAFSSGTPTAGRSFYIDSVQVEAKTYCTPYADGSLDVVQPDGTSGQHSWSGTAHASSSTRTASRLTQLTAGNIKAEIGTVMAWIKPINVGHAAQVILLANGSTAGQILLRLNASGQLAGTWGTSTVTYTTTPLTAKVWTHVAMTYNGATVKLYINGTEVNSGSSSGFSGMPTTMFIGRTNSAAQYLNGYLDELAILDRAATADEIRAIYESDAPVFAETSTFQFTAPNQLVWADENGLFVRSSDGAAAFGVVGVDGYSWGGQAMDSGDLMIGNTSDANLLWDLSNGRINIRGGSTVQSYIDTDGTIVAAAGDLLLNAAGVSLRSGSSWEDVTAYKFFDDDDGVLGGLYAAGGPGMLMLLSAAPPSGTAWIDILAQADNSTLASLIRLTASDYTYSVEFGVRTLNNDAYAWLDGIDFRGLNLGGQGTPDGLLQVHGDIVLQELPSNPATPNSGSQLKKYMKGDKYIIQYNHGGTVKYRYLDLTSTDATWTYTTSAP